MPPPKKKGANDVLRGRHPSGRVRRDRVVGMLLRRREGLGLRALLAALPPRAATASRRRRRGRRRRLAPMRRGSPGAERRRRLHLPGRASCRRPPLRHRGVEAHAWVATEADHATRSEERPRQVERLELWAGRDDAVLDLASMLQLSVDRRADQIEWERRRIVGIAGVDAAPADRAADRLAVVADAVAALLPQRVVVVAVSILATSGCATSRSSSASAADCTRRTTASTAGCRRSP